LTERDNQFFLLRQVYYFTRKRIIFEISMRLPSVSSSRRSGTRFFASLRFAQNDKYL